MTSDSLGALEPVSTDSSSSSAALSSCCCCSLEPPLDEAAAELDAAGTATAADDEDAAKLVEAADEDDDEDDADDDEEDGASIADAAVVLDGDRNPAGAVAAAAVVAALPFRPLVALAGAGAGAGAAAGAILPSVSEVGNTAAAFSAITTSLPAAVEVTGAVAAGCCSVRPRLASTFSGCRTTQRAREQVTHYYKTILDQGIGPLVAPKQDQTHTHLVFGLVRLALAPSLLGHLLAPRQQLGWRRVGDISQGASLQQGFQDAAACVVSREKFANEWQQHSMIDLSAGLTCAAADAGATAVASPRFLDSLQTKQGGCPIDSGMESFV